MSDLISRSKVISVLEQLEEHSLTGKMDISNAIYLLNNQPTAYDIDKVVDELEKIRAKETCNKEKCDTKEICRICVVDDAIEIVKQGGVADDVCEWKLDGDMAINPHTFIKYKVKQYDSLYALDTCQYCRKKIKVVE